MTRATECYATGGGVRGDLWPQILADITGMTQHVTAGAIGACYGDAFLAGMAAGLVQHDTSWVSVERTLTPDPSTAGIYERYYQRYRALHPATLDVQHALAAMQRD